MSLPNVVRCVDLVAATRQSAEGGQEAEVGSSMVADWRHGVNNMRWEWIRSLCPLLLSSTRRIERQCHDGQASAADGQAAPDTPQPPTTRRTSTCPLERCSQHHIPRR